MIFLTSNLGAREIESIVQPKLGFAAGVQAPAAAVMSRAGQLASAGVSAARRAFAPEFLNRIDRTIVFNPLGEAEIRRILAIELDSVRDRLHRVPGAGSVTFTASDAAQNFLLREGIDPRYGARHLRRAVERLLVQPMANLLATGQVQPGDWLLVDFDQAASCLTFHKGMKEPASAAPPPSEAAAAA
jgi:ATP-dependent Clp protease ATP-binding subunit ClpA